MQMCSAHFQQSITFEAHMIQSVSTPESIQTRCCVVGGGPAGMMLGFLLARAGIDVVVLEKHADFFRDFRGDTIHPSTLELMHELGLLDEFLRLPHQALGRVRMTVNGEVVPVADFSHLPTHCKFIAFMPQWDFLNFLAEQAGHYPRFRLKMNSEATSLIEDGDRVAGVRAATPAGEMEVRADLVVAADGRYSTVRERAGLEIINRGVPIDVLWLRLSKKADDPEQSLGHLRGRKMMVMIDRGEYWQCGVVIPKGGLEDIRRQGLESFRDYIAGIAPFMRDRIAELNDWDDVKLLTVQINRLRRWFRPGLLCIGDSAHAMSPAGGVGVNLAIQDAVAAANLLADKLREGGVETGDLQKVQQRREWPVRVTQGIQAFIHSRVTGRASPETRDSGLPLPIRLLRRLPFLRRFPAYAIGLGFRPEHVNPHPAQPEP
jgi:2-polyprenyl-6-methoxyphenol hydroxylase-like FAD-dependent oxidoreductase